MGYLIIYSGNIMIYISDNLRINMTITRSSNFPSLMNSHTQLFVPVVLSLLSTVRLYTICALKKQKQNNLGIFTVIYLTFHVLCSKTLIMFYINLSSSKDILVNQYSKIGFPTCYRLVMVFLLTLIFYCASKF